jgi:23S rRNA (uridine2552-2'-O)-methyltransferase
LQGAAIDLLLSDMAPNITGIADVDRQSWRKLLDGLELVLGLYLKKGGNSCIKLFSGPDLKPIQQRFSTTFQSIKVIKPSASKAHSKEVYLFARGYRGIMSAKI